jgi:hypothetical protein
MGLPQMTSSDESTNILNDELVNIWALEKNLSVEARQLLKDQEHKIKQDGLDKEAKRVEDRYQNRHKRHMEIGLCGFGAIGFIALGGYSINIISNPSAPSELTKWACGLLGTFAGASVGLIRRP